MNQNQINALLKDFFITEEELKSREIFQEFSNSLSDIIIDEFAQNYLLNNPTLSVYLAHTDGSMLLKKIKGFLAFAFTAPVDEEYVKRIHFIGSIHHSIKLDPSKVSYGFWALNEILNKMAGVNEIVRENRILLSKLLRFIERLMNDGFYIVQERLKKNDEDEFQGFNAQNELYVGFNLHKLNMKKISLAIQNRDVQVLESIEEESSNCAFGKIIHELNGNEKHEFILGFNASSIEEAHDQWHKEYVKIKGAIAIKDDQSIEQTSEKLKSLTAELEETLDKTLKDSLEDGHLSLNSGIQAMKKMTNLFYEKTYVMEENLESFLSKIVKDVVLAEFSWALEEARVENENVFEEEYAIVKRIRYETKNAFIGVKLKKEHNGGYLIKMINLLFEALSLHLSVKEREASLITFADKAENANKSKDVFLANMSHELRTPLNAITGFSQILMMKKETPQSVKKYVEKINIAGNNLLDLVNTILDFAKLEAGKMQFNPSLSNISNVLNEVNTLISPLASNKEITLKMPNIVSLNLYIDKVLFKQVLINLLTNAVKFTPKGGDVSLSVVYDSAKHKYVFEVKDNGVGLSQESITKLFQAFSQVENSYQKEHKGTGLGLMISKKIVEELHKGIIWVESEEGKGSSFFVSMPTPMVESHTYYVKEAPKDAKSVLVVEDSESYQKILIEHLKETHNLTLTDTINKAKNLLVKERYDFIILDFFLTDGISSEILEFMEEENIGTSVIVISAEDEIHISSSLANFSNLECIINKKNVLEICASLRGEAYS